MPSYIYVKPLFFLTEEGHPTKVLICLKGAITTNNYKMRVWKSNKLLLLLEGIELLSKYLQLKIAFICIIRIPN